MFEQYGHDNRPPKGGMPMDIPLSATAELRHGKYHVRREALDGKARDVALAVRY